MADTRTGRLPETGRLQKTAASSGVLTCQWCSVDLQPGVTICPTCGSPGVPDSAMVVPDPIGVVEADKLDLDVQSEDELVEWWKEEGETSVYENSAADLDNPLPMILGLVGGGVFCVLLGIFIVPPLLSSLFENNFGIIVEDPNDLRPLGGVLGLLVAAFIGAIAMWAAKPRP